MWSSKDVLSISGVAIIAFLSLSKSLVAQSTASQATAAQSIQLTPSKISVIKPGTTIGNQAPEGWNYLLFKNRSTVGAGDMDYASESIKHLASFLSSVMVAKVENRAAAGSTPRYEITDLGYGLFARVGNADKVVSYQSYQEVGADFGLLESTALSAAEKRIGRLQISAKTPTMYLADSPTAVLLNKTHQDVIVRHAILVEPETGSMVTLVWFIEPSKNKQPAKVISDLDFLPPNTELSVVLHLDRSQFSFGIITEKALALNQMTWGKSQIKVPAALVPLAVLPKFSAEQLTQLEAQLRSLIRPSTPR